MKIVEIIDKNRTKSCPVFIFPLTNAGKCSKIQTKTYVRNMKGTHKDSNGWSVPNWKCQEGLDKILEIKEKHNL